MTEGFAPMDVAQMNLDEGQRDCRQRVAKCNAGMRERSGINDEKGGAVGVRCIGCGRSARLRDYSDKRALLRLMSRNFS